MRSVHITDFGARRSFGIGTQIQSVSRPCVGHQAQRDDQAWVLPLRNDPQRAGPQTPHLEATTVLLPGKHGSLGKAAPQNRLQPDVYARKQVSPGVTGHASNACPLLCDKNARMDEQTLSSLARRPHPGPGTAGVSGPWGELLHPGKTGRGLDTGPPVLCPALYQAIQESPVLTFAPA